MSWRGFQYSTPNISELDVFTDFKILQRQTAQLCPTSKEAAERSRCELAAAARGFAGTKPDTRDFSLQREHRKVLKDLRMNHDLVITRPDKGRATVLLTKTSYVEKMMIILRDERKFLSLGPVPEFDMTAKIEQKLEGI